MSEKPDRTAAIPRRRELTIMAVVLVTGLVAVLGIAGWRLWDTQRTEESHQRGEDRDVLSEQESLATCGDAVRGLLEDPDSATLTVSEVRENAGARAWDITGHVVASGHFVEDAVHSGIIDPTTTEVGHRYSCYVTSEGVIVGFVDAAAQWSGDAVGTLAPVAYSGPGVSGTSCSQVPTNSV